MKRAKWFYHPIFIFIFSIFALVTSLGLYIYWYVKVSTGLETVARKFNIDPGQVLKAETWLVIMVLSILVGIILMGIFTIFVYNQKTLQLYRLQNNFINNFTHELKTPVTSLKLYLETFARHDISREEQLKFIHYMLQDVSRLSDNINRILNLARIESKNYGGEFIVADIISLTNEFYKNNKYLFKNCIVSIHDYPGKSFLYLVNPPLFEMLLINLLTNAVKYNKSKTPEINVRFKKRKNKFYLLVSDNGIGLEKSEIKKIFRKFYQVGRSDNMSAKGSGLGLFLVQSVARIHKGKVIARSKGQGSGSVFILILPDQKGLKIENQ